MKITWKSPYHTVTEDILIGNTTLRITGLYNDGEPATEGEAPTAPVKPSFEMGTVYLIVDTPQGQFPLDVTTMLDDINSITWRKGMNNDLYDWISERMIDKCRDA